jgi:tRNA(adenine34) deaminase
VKVARPGASLRNALRHRILLGVTVFSDTDETLMRRALDLASAAAEAGDVPIGAVIAREGDVLGAAGNEREQSGDPTAHAEILALRQASVTLGGWRLPDTTLYVTLEPCAMCAGAIATADPKAGAVGGVMNIYTEGMTNHTPAIESGLLQDEAAAMLSGFFAERRSGSEG